MLLKYDKLCLLIFEKIFTVCKLVKNCAVTLKKSLATTFHQTNSFFSSLGSLHFPLPSYHELRSTSRYLSLALTLLQLLSCSGLSFSQQRTFSLSFFSSCCLAHWCFYSRCSPVARFQMVPRLTLMAPRLSTCSPRKMIASRFPRLHQPWTPASLV